MKALKIITAALVGIGMVSCQKDAKLTVSFPERFEGKTAVLTQYMDSTVIDSVSIENGLARFDNLQATGSENPVFTTLTVDGRIKAYYILESGNAVAMDSTSTITGTPLNDRLASILHQLDSVDNLDDLGKYTDFVESVYNENKDNVIGDYLGVEWLKTADPTKIDSMLNTTSPAFREAKRVKHYVALSHQRGATATGMKYVDFQGENAKGGKMSFSSMITPGHYTLVDFWASWCPYCIKELPALQSLYDDLKSKGVDVIGVAVRDNVADTKAMVKKKDIKWPILYNTQREPYDIYGFTGIPHHILIGPDGTIISRGENVEQLRQRLNDLMGQ